jgi:hypothetical protein
MSLLIVSGSQVPVVRGKMDRSHCGTLNHIYLSHLADRDKSGLRVGWKETLRDAWYGILIWLTACLVVLFTAGPVWVFVPVGLLLGTSVLVAAVRLTIGHSIKCSLMYAIHWPLQLGELI